MKITIENETNKEVKLTKKERRKLKVEGEKKVAKERRMKLKEYTAVKIKQKETERKDDEVIMFKEKIENEVKIDSGHKVEAETKILGDLKTENELVMNSENETKVMLEKGLVAEAGKG